MHKMNKAIVLSPRQVSRHDYAKDGMGICGRQLLVINSIVALVCGLGTRTESKKGSF